MKRLLVPALAALAALLALHHPAPPAAIASIATPPAMQHAPSQHSRTGRSSQKTGDASVVYVVGAVAHAGLYRLAAGARVNDAIQRAGGLRADADPATVNLAERVSDGEEIHVLRMGEAAAHSARRTSGKKRARPSTNAPAASIDLNAADATALAGIPGIGPTLAARIVEYRRVNGPFLSLDELSDVAGMTQRRIDALSEYVTVGS
jgi:competence protein ComEA